MRALCLAAAALLGAAAGAGAADTLRCGGEVVSTGDIKFEVLAKCGEPAYRDVRQEERSTRVHRGGSVMREDRVTVTIDEWTYNFGPGRFLYVVRFENGKVIELSNEGFGR